jgi:tRNA (mo5U34)-methyltransferase
VVAEEGIFGLTRRITRKLSPRRKTIRGRNTISEAPLVTKAKQDYQQLVSTFRERTARRGHEDLSKYYWYHTIDLGDGLVTPGDYDYRSSLPPFQFPEDMRGMTVLDVGSATGFFAFEFEKRGAIVTSVELPSIADWDMPVGEDAALRDLMEFLQVGTVEEVHHFALDGPFEFCRKLLNSKVRRCHSTIYDLTPQKLGTEAFDLVYVGDVLLHTFSPFKALCSVAPLCRGTLVIAQGLSAIADDTPVMQYVGGESLQGDNRTWFHPNKLCLEQMLKRLGFKTVSEVGRYTGVARRNWVIYERSIIHAKK